jgi:hypothetical protein
MKEIKLTRGLFAIVDDENYEELNKYKWKAKKDNKTFYAIRNKLTPEGKEVIMHRQVAGCKTGEIVDHIDRNGLNNQKSNLRKCSMAENVRNSRKSSLGKSSIFKGVSRSWTRTKGKKYYYLRSIVYSGEDRYVKYFKDGDFENAARWYDKKATEIFGEFACTNESLGLYKNEIR